MNPSWRLGFELLDNPLWRTKFEGELRKAGYRLDVEEPASHLIKQFDMQLRPLGRGNSLILRLEQDWAQDWTTGILYRASEEVVRLDFNRHERHAVSCYEVWIDAIIAAVVALPSR
jgi:hypothetical protein